MPSIYGIPLVKPRELNQGGTSTSEIVFTSDGTTPVILYFPTAEQFCSANGRGTRRFAVRANGRVTGGTTTNYTPQLQFGTSATASSNTDLESGGAVAVNSVDGNWFIEWEGIVDATSNKLLGLGRYGVYGSTETVADWTDQDNDVSTADPDGNGTLGFVVTGTFSGGSASNTAHLDTFVLELLD